MKKIYIAPMIETEEFQTCDIITVSMRFNTGTHNAQTDKDPGVPEVDISKQEFVEYK